MIIAKIPFTIEQFFQVFEKYNQAIYPIQFALILGAIIVIYPLIGYALGRIFPSTPTFGTPCPTTIFTFGLLLWADRKISLSLLIIPVLWSIVGTSAALNFGVKEDFGLLVAATMGTAAIVQHNLTLKTAQTL